MTMEQLGLKANPNAINGTLVYEAPINVLGAKINGFCSVGAFTYINGPSSVTDAVIGRYCSIGWNVEINPGQHYINALSTHPFTYDPVDTVARLADFEEYRRVLVTERPPRTTPKRRGGPVTIGADVWIGCNVVVLSNLVIGHGAIVGAGAVVSKNVPPYAIVAGNPARVVGYRFDEPMIARLLKLQWWQYDFGPIKDELDMGDIASCAEHFETALAEGRIKPFSLRLARLVRQGGEINYERLS